MIDADLLDRFGQRIRDIDTYARTWWAMPVEPQASYLREHPDVRARLLELVARNAEVGTQHVYSRVTTDGNLDHAHPWDPGRTRLHEDILRRLDTGSTTHPAEDFETRQSAVYFLLGLPGSGKTRSLRPIVQAHAQVSGPVPAVDADEVRVLLPEYADGLGSGVVQFETAMLAYGLGYRLGDGRQQRVWAYERTTIVDTIGNADFLPRTVSELASQGRKVYVLRTDCPIETCVERAMRRTLESGRYVPIELIREKAGFPEAALDGAIATGAVAGWAVVDTAKEPVRVTQAGGQLADMVSVRPG